MSVPLMLTSAAPNTDRPMTTASQSSVSCARSATGSEALIAMSDMPVPRNDPHGGFRPSIFVVRMMARVSPVDDLGKKAMSGQPDQRRTPTFFPQRGMMKIIFPQTGHDVRSGNAPYRAAADTLFGRPTSGASL